MLNFSKRLENWQPLSRRKMGGDGLVEKRAHGCQRRLEYLSCVKKLRVIHLYRQYNDGKQAVLLQKQELHVCRY